MHPLTPIETISGRVGRTAREYPVASATVLTEGQAVKLSGGAVVSAAANETGALLGLCAEYHSGSPDALNPRADGERVLVYDDPGLVFECDAPVFTATGGTATTVVTDTSNVACTTADAFKGALLVDALGRCRAVTAFANSDTTVQTFTVASGDAPSAGDVFTLLPFAGQAAGFALDAAAQKIVLTATGCTGLRVVGFDAARRKLRLCAANHLYA